MKIANNSKINRLSILIILLLITVLFQDSLTAENVTAVYNRDDNTLVVTNNRYTYLIIKKDDVNKNFFGEIDSRSKSLQNIELIKKLSGCDSGQCYIVGYEESLSIFESIDESIIEEVLKYELSYHLILRDSFDTGRVEISIVGEKRDDIKEHDEVLRDDSLDINKIIIIIGGALIIMVIIIILILKKKKKSKVENKIVITQNLFEVEEEAEENDLYEIGIGHVIKNIDDYYCIDLRENFSDTSIHKVYLKSTVIKSIYDIFNKFLESSDRTPETGCYLIGCWDFSDDLKTSYNISLESIIQPGDDAVYGEYTLNFGKKIGVILGSTLSNLREKTGMYYVHTAWMHSHPGLGLFLSSQDLFVQKQLACPDHKNRMLAIVIDTNTEDFRTALFPPKNSGVMNNKEDMKITYSFDMFYSWSKKRQEEIKASIVVDDENYYIVALNNSNINKLIFSAKVINGIDDLIYSNNNGLIGFLDGFEKYNKSNDTISIIVENVTTNKNDDAIACLIADVNKDFSIIIDKYSETIDKFDFFVLYVSDNEMYVSFKDENGSYSLNDSFYNRISLEEMKKWTRRPRL
jgi:hypothetical protein